MAAQRTLEPPVPGPTAVRLLRVPDVSPPFDGEVLPAGGAPAPAADVWAPLPALPVAAPPPPVPAAVRGPHDDSWAVPFARLLTETLAGIRPMRQIEPWMTDRSRAHARRAVPVLRCGHRPRVLRVLVSHPDDAVAEVSVIAGLGPRTKALALRMEKITARPGQPAHWVCTDIETG